VVIKRQTTPWPYLRRSNSVPGWARKRRTPEMTRGFWWYQGSASKRARPWLTYFSISFCSRLPSPPSRYFLYPCDQSINITLCVYLLIYCSKATYCARSVVEGNVPATCRIPAFKHICTETYVHRQICRAILECCIICTPLMRRNLLKKHVSFKQPLALGELSKQLNTSLTTS
jgi:hypothetical protein